MSQLVSIWESRHTAGTDMPPPIELRTLAECGQIWTRIYPEYLDYLGHDVAQNYTEAVA